MLPALIIQMPLWLWWLIVRLKSLGEVHRFSAWRALGASLIGLLLFGGVALVAFLVFGAIDPNHRRGGFLMMIDYAVAGTGAEGWRACSDSKDRHDQVTAAPSKHMTTNTSKAGR